MFGPWRNREAKPTAVGASVGEALVYAIGDVHGRLDLMTKMLEAIRADAHASNYFARPHVIFLGDYIDRGPESRGVIQHLVELWASGEFQLECLFGNHEERMLDFLGDERYGPAWMRCGGEAALLSYGVRPPPLAEAEAKAWTRTRDELDDVLPPSHLRFLFSLRDMAQIGDYAFVHAGVRPGVPLDDQDPKEMRWIRRPFLDHEEPFEKVIVHGHTPVEKPKIGGNRINVDTGAFLSGRLTAVRLFRDRASFLVVEDR